MEIRSPLLNSALVKSNLLPGVPLDSDLGASFDAIDRIGRLYDTLRATHETVDPHENPQARAMRYETQYQKAVTKAREVALAAAARLDANAAVIDSSAVYQAGLHTKPETAAEIRAALRSMTPAEREKAVSEAFKNRDTEILASIHGASAVTWGGIKAPIKDVFKAYIDEVSPDWVRQRENLAKVTGALDLAADSFVKSADKWRDQHNAEIGFRQQEEFEKATTAFNSAVRG
jgi:hypothetical protein